MKRGGVILLLVLLTLSAVVAGTYLWIKSRQAEIQQTRDQRAERIQQINARLLQQELGAEILDKELDSHCGSLVYIVEYRDASGAGRKAYFDIESGEPMPPDWLRSCLKLPEAS